MFSLFWNRAPSGESQSLKAADTGRRAADIRQSRGDANTSVLGDLSVLRARSRALTESNPYGAHALTLMVNHIVGPGILGQPRASAQVQQLWQNWANDPGECDYDGDLTFNGIQALVTRCLVESGECLLLRHQAPDNQTVPLRLQVLEPDFIDTNRRVGVHTDTTVDHAGIRFANGRRLGYWLWSSHPGSTLVPNSVTSNFYPAERVIHLYRKDRPGQIRGFPWATPLLLALKDFDDTLDSEQLRQKMATAFVGFVTDLRDGLTTDEAPKLEELAPGTIEILPPGRDIKLTTPPQTPNFQSFTHVALRRIAAGYNVSYEGLTGDYSQVNFSSAKMSANEFDATIESWRASTLLPRFLTPVWRWWLDEADLFNGTDIDWTPPRARLLDPQKEVAALREQVRSGFISWGEAVKRFGGDPARLMEEIADTNSRLDELDLIFDSDGRYSEHGLGRLSEEPLNSPGEDPEEATP